jgi:tetratricopeptide (TPR) repeat protein
VSPARRTGRLDPDRLAELEEQRDFLLRSLRDLEREHDAGDLTDEDYETLRDDYTARAADALRALEDEQAAFAAARPERSVGRTVAWVAATAVFALVAGLVAANAMGARKAGESASGGVSVKQTPSQRATECSTQMQTDPDGTFECFQDILEDDPNNPVALTWSAWQLSLSADSFSEPDRSNARALAAVRLDAAVESDPNYSYARAFRAVVAYRNGRYADAQRYLAEFRERNPSAQAAQVIEQMDLEARIEQAIAEEGPVGTTTVPTGGAGASSTTSTSTVGSIPSN